jgi:hypothetical protein
MSWIISNKHLQIVAKIGYLYYQYSELNVSLLILLGWDKDRTIECRPHQ